MNTNELRIGNYVSINGEYVQVESISNSHVNEVFPKEKCFPIQLSKDIILNFGFKIHNETNYFINFLLKSCNFAISLALENEFKPFKSFKQFESGVCYFGEENYEIRFLHELQNIIYFITKKEVYNELF